MHPQQQHDAYQQCVAEMDRRAPEAHLTAHQFRQLARSRQLPKQLEAFFKARDAYMAGPASAQRGPGRGGGGARSGAPGMNLAKCVYLDIEATGLETEDEVVAISIVDAAGAVQPARSSPVRSPRNRLQARP